MGYFAAMIAGRALGGGWIALLLLGLAWRPVHAQPAHTRLLTTADGLADRVVTDVHRDARGFLWVLGPKGLQRYDGVRFRSYTALVPDSLQRALIGVANLHVDPEGWIWLVATDGRCALRVDPLTERTEVHRAPVVLPTVAARARICTNLYPFYDLLRPLGGAAGARQAVLRALGGDELRAIQRGTDGTVWLHLRDARLLAMDPRTGAVHEPPHPAVAPGRSSWPTIDRAGTLWLPGPGSQLHAFATPPDLLRQPELVPHLDDGGGYWLTALDNHLYELDPRTGAWRDHGVQAAKVHRIYRDAEGLVWLCTEAGLIGLRTVPDLFAPVGGRQLADVRELVGNSMRGLVELPQGGHIAFNDAGRLQRIAPDGTLTPLPLTWPDGRGAFVSALQRAADGSLWGFSEGRFFHLELGAAAGTAHHQPTPAPVVALYAPPGAGTFVLLLEQDRAVRFEVRTRRYGTPFPLAQAPRAGALPTGTHLVVPDAHGLRVVDMRTGAVRPIDLQLPAPLMEGDVRALVPLGPKLYLATAVGVLGVDTATWRVVQRVGYTEGLADNVVYSLLAENGRLWAGTRNGLSLVDTATGRCVNFRIQDGLPFNEFNTGAVLVDREGRCWMGGVNGFARFDPARVAAVDRIPAPLHLAQMRSYDQRAATWTDALPGTDAQPFAIVLQPHARTLSIAFMLAALADPGANRYSYFLEGLEPPWFHTGAKAEADYLDLPPGRYVFRVKAYDHRGGAAANELAIPVTVLQVWYLRTWALVLWGLLAVAGAILLARLVIRRRLEQAEAARIKELDAFKDRFFANVTHEFRTPITVMMGLAGQVENGADPATASEKANVIRRNGQRLLALLEQIMDLTRVQHGRLQLHPASGHLLPFLRHTLGAHRSLAEVRGIGYHVQVEGEETPVLYDAERLRQIADNLVSNAIKFTPTGGQVHVQATLVTGAPGTFTLEVRDSGAGIAAADLPHVFERFYQGSGPNGEAPSGGTGIGLALVKELVEAMQGRVSVESRAGAGATFRVQLPVERATDLPAETAPVMAAQPRAAQQADAAVPDDERPQLLVVEDDPDLGDYIVGCLGDGFRVLRAMDGLQGVALAVEQVPDLVLSDVMMPGLDGYGLCQQLKADARTSHIPVALLTARSDQPSRLEGIAQGADAYLVKPFDERELRGVLQNLLRLQRSIQQRYRQEWTQQAAPPAPEPLVPQPARPTPPEPLAPDIEHVFLAEVRRLLEQHHTDPDYSVERLAEHLHLSRSQALRKIKALTGSTPVALLRDFRLARAQQLLDRGGYTVAQVAYDCGFSTPNYFSDVYLSVYGHRPSERMKV